MQKTCFRYVYYDTDYRAVIIKHDGGRIEALDGTAGVPDRNPPISKRLRLMKSADEVKCPACGGSGTCSVTTCPSCGGSGTIPRVGGRDK
jgi:RecJ-like exonuclease